MPSNLYLIGTMNTADRSLAGLDIALRRRFTFRDMPPRPELLKGLEVEGIDIASILEKLNQRIEVLLDRDHCVGHAYFLALRGDCTLMRLATIFRSQIVPLLQEYFFEDWERIGWVLNDQKALSNGSEPFIRRPKEELSLTMLFGSDNGWKTQRPALGVERCSVQFARQLSQYIGLNAVARHLVTIRVRSPNDLRGRTVA